MAVDPGMAEYKNKKHSKEIGVTGIQTLLQPLAAYFIDEIKRCVSNLGGMPVFPLTNTDFVADSGLGIKSFLLVRTLIKEARLEKRLDQKWLK